MPKPKYHELDRVVTRFSNGWTSKVREVSIETTKKTPFGYRYLCRLDITWTDEGYTESVRHWKWGWQLALTKAHPSTPKAKEEGGGNEL